MNASQAIAVRFCDGRAIEISKAFDYADSYVGNRGYVSPQEIIWEDGSYSYAKGWWGNAQAGFKPCLVRVGAGAYGDMLIIQRANQKIAA